jgi:hypothetical protein
MTKASKQSKKAKPDNKSKRFYFIHPWQSQHHAECSEITAYTEKGSWEKVLTVHPTSDATAENMAIFVLDLINDNQRNRNLLFEAMHALEAVLEDGGLNYTNEQDAGSVINRIKKRIGE